MFLYLPSCKNLGVDVFFTEDSVLYAVNFCQSFYLFKTLNTRNCFSIFICREGTWLKIKMFLNYYQFLNINFYIYLRYEWYVKPI